VSDTSAVARVGIVVTSHSAQIAEGIVQLAVQMAPNVALEPAGGSDDGGIGTSFTRVAAAIDAAERGVGVVILCDLGSAIMTAETARELLDESRRRRVLIADAPLVEGSVAAAISAELGGDLRTVYDAAQSARGVQTTPVTSAGDECSGQEPFYVRSVTLVNDDGLHARPAAEFVKLAATFPARVTVNGKDAKSLLGIMSLGLLRGATVQIAAPIDGSEAVDALAELIESGFGGKPAV
jgi:phosphoenolpyruvate---glycerone phosphotransferase subunit DhaM